MQGSNSLHLTEYRFDGDAEDEAQWVPCKRCFETGEDADGADCIHCDGMGAVKLR